MLALLSGILTGADSRRKAAGKPDITEPTLRRFSSLAGFAFVLVFASGVINASIRITSWARPLRLPLRAADPGEGRRHPGAGRHRPHAPPVGHPAAGPQGRRPVRPPRAVAAGPRGTAHHGRDVGHRRRAGPLRPAAAHHLRPGRFPGLHPLRLRAAARTDPGTLADRMAAGLAVGRRRRSSAWCPTSSASARSCGAGTNGPGSGP